MKFFSNIYLFQKNILSILVILVISGTSVADETDQSSCDSYNPLKQAYFGDLHIHTGLSADAMLFGTTNRPDDAYAFAQGKSISIQKLTDSIDGLTTVTIERPLDFAAVTDHAENIGTVSLCTNPESAVYNTKDCQFVRKPLPTHSMAAFSSELTKVFHTMYFSENICGKDRSACKAAVYSPWQEIQRSANNWNKQCEFTTFIGYEYSQTLQGSNLHHNVIFANENVTDVPISSRDVPGVFDFYQKLNNDCNLANENCQAIAIPHNSNISNGKMFSLDYPGDKNNKHRWAQLRADIVPVVESFQEKGDSECRNGLWNVIGQNDEFCEFEKYRNWPVAGTQQAPIFDDCELGSGAGGFQNKGCVSRLDYTRTAIAAGIAEQQSIGVNSLKFGFIGSTDNHYGTTADVEEWVHDGTQRPIANVEPGRMSTGGIAGVWAEENTREALFAAMKRREVFATSGPRIALRLFAAEKIDEKMCSQPYRIKTAYKEGVPMGGELALTSSTSAPHFLAIASQDPGTSSRPGSALQQMQIIKVWPGKNNQLHQKVIRLAGENSSANVDSNTCQQFGQGHTQFCRVWKDPDYDPDIEAAYYLRVLENPSCRSTGFTCSNSELSTKPAYCEQESMIKTIQERAWSSPVWVTTQK